MKFAYIATALLAAATSAFAVAVQPASAEDSSILADPVYKWRVLESGFETSNVTAVNATNGVSLVKRKPTLNCYHKGRAVRRAALVSSIDTFCTNNARGRTVKNGDVIWVRYVDDFSGVTVLVRFDVIANCTPWTIGSECNVNFRIPVDRCNMEGENGKQGGEMWDDCAKYRIDHGDKGSDDW